MFKYFKIIFLFLCTIFIFPNTFAADEGPDQIAVGAVLNNGYPTPLFLSSKDRGETWNTQDISKIIPNYNNSGEFKAAHCSGTTCVIVGDSDYATYPLLIATSHDSGKTWSSPQHINNLPNFHNISMEAVSCSDKTCSALGRADNEIVLLFSKDNGVTWTYTKNITNYPTNFTKFGKLKQLHCEGNVCVITGSYIHVIGKHQYDEELFFSLASKDGGETWYFALPPRPNYNNIIDPSIVNTAYAGNHTWVMLIKYFNTTPQDLPLFSSILISEDDAKTWHAINDIQNLPSDLSAYIANLDCDNGSCTAVGMYVDEEHHPWYLSIASEDNGKTWVREKRVAKNFTVDIMENVFTCKNKTCLLAQYENNTPQFFVTHDNGHHWLASNVKNFPENIEATRIKSISYRNGTWLAVGYLSNHSVNNQIVDWRPLILRSDNDGVDWNYVEEIKGLPKKFDDAKLVSSGDTALIDVGLVDDAIKN